MSSDISSFEITLHGKEQDFPYVPATWEAKRLIQFQARKKENNYMFTLQHTPVGRRDTWEKKNCAYDQKTQVLAQV